MRGVRILFSVFLGVGLILILGIRGCHSYKEAAEEKQKVAAAYVATHPPAPILAPVIKIGKEPTTHQFGSNGCAEVWLEGNWVSYPQPLDASIRFYDQWGRLVLEQGAKKQGSSLPSTNYRICRAPRSHATGVQIWN